MAKKRKASRSGGGNGGNRKPQWAPRRRAKDDDFTVELAEQLLCSSDSADAIANLCDARLEAVEGDRRIAQLYAEFWREQADGPGSAVAAPMGEFVRELVRHQETLVELMGRLDRAAGDDAMHQDVTPTPEVLERIGAGIARMLAQAEGAIEISESVSGPAT